MTAQPSSRLYVPRSFCTRLSTESFEGSDFRSKQSQRQLQYCVCWAAPLTVRMIFARDFQQRREGRLIPIHREPDPVCDLSPKQPMSMPNQPLSPERPRFSTATYVLIDQQDRDVGPLCVFLESRFDDRRRCLYDYRDRDSTRYRY